jgi:hypothetical protein
MSPVQKFISDLKAEGFRVWIPGGSGSWVYFSFNDQLGYATYSQINAWEFITVHVPCIEYGTGFRYAHLINYNLTEYAKNCCQTSVPYGFGTCKVQKWKLESWIKKNPTMKEV